MSTRLRNRDAHFSSKCTCDPSSEVTDMSYERFKKRHFSFEGFLDAQRENYFVFHKDKNQR